MSPDASVINNAPLGPVRPGSGPKAAELLSIVSPRCGPKPRMCQVRYALPPCPCLLTRQSWLAATPRSGSVAFWVTGGAMEGKGRSEGHRLARSEKPAASSVCRVFVPYNCVTPPRPAEGQLLILSFLRIQLAILPLSPVDFFRAAPSLLPSSSLHCLPIGRLGHHRP